MKVKALLIGCLLASSGWTEANAAVIISTNSITDPDPGLSNPYVTGLINDPNITASGIGRGTGLTAVTGTANRYIASGWSTTSAPGANSYFTFTLDANPGYKVNFTNFVYTGQAGNAGNAPTSFAFRSSVDGFVADIGSPTATGTTIDLSAPQFQNLTNPIEFRFYGYNAAGTSGRYSINNYTFNGTVAAVPEPASIALLGVGSLLMGGYLRRTRSEADTVA
ncbi:MAG: PEP-CTERM sorting domain-containing protein [Chlorobaculum sp.]|jgi:hypothetical protein|nr:PEP-CTERM sorting domain-containing protein [Chlorobaculum sp.]